MTDSNTSAVNPQQQQQAVAAAPAAAPSGTDSTTQLAAARAELEALKHEREVELAQHEQELIDLRVKNAIAQANKPAAALNSGQADALRTRLIAQFTNCKWNAMPAEQRCALQGVSDSASVKDADLRKHFAKDSSLNATQLAKTDPAKYHAWRIIARERGIF